MPYITKGRRPDFEYELNSLAYKIKLHEPGELSYIISSLLARLVTKENINGGINYARLSKWRGVIIDASDEFYRRVMAPYEDIKQEENGDVYDNVFEV